MAAIWLLRTLSPEHCPCFLSGSDPPGCLELQRRQWIRGGSTTGIQPTFGGGTSSRVGFSGNASGVSSSFDASCGEPCLFLHSGAQLAGSPMGLLMTSPYFNVEQAKWADSAGHGQSIERVDQLAL